MKAKQEIEEYKNKYLRALADYQNLEKRYFSEKKEAERQITQRILDRFLLVLDDIDRASAFIKDEGLIMIAKQFQTALEDMGVSELDVLNKPFDPHTAEALEVVPGDKDNIVLEVVRRGYQLGDTILRPAQVKVSKTVEK